MRQWFGGFLLTEPIISVASSIQNTWDGTCQHSSCWFNGFTYLQLMLMIVLNSTKWLLPRQFIVFGVWGF